MTETATLNLADFLLARVAEDEAVASEVRPHEHLHDRDRRLIDGGWRNGYGIVQSTSGRVLAECEAKRRIVENCRVDYEYHLTSGDDTGDLATETLMMLAAVYADHPDYRDEWRP